MWCRGSGDFITTENVSIDGIVNGAQAASAAWFIDGGGQNGYKLWNTTISNADKVAVETYRVNNFSMQKVTLLNCGQGIYQKSSGTGHTALSLRFIDFGTSAARFSGQSGATPSSHSIIQHCVFANTDQVIGNDQIRFDYVSSSAGSSDKHWIVGNVFYNYDYSTLASIRVEKSAFEDVQIFNNIFLLSDRPWRFDQNSPEISNYNTYWDAGTSMEFEDNNVAYSSLAALQAATSFEANAVNSDPLFTNVSLKNFTLQGGSPSLTSGVDGTQQGLYLGNFYTVGAS